MKRVLLDSWKSFLRLARFLFWYALAIGVLLYVMPSLGLIVEHGYDALSSTVKFYSVLGVFAVIGAWHVIERCVDR